MIPNLLSLIRLVTGPLLFLDLSDQQRFGLIVVAGVTDWLDGWLARRWNQSTPTGALLDPLADKVFALFALGFCWQQERLSIPGLVALVSRDGALALVLLVAAFRKLAGNPSRLYLGTCWASKVFTTMQFLAVAALVVGLEVPVPAYCALGVLAAVAFKTWLAASLRVNPLQSA